MRIWGFLPDSGGGVGFAARRDRNREIMNFDFLGLEGWKLFGRTSVSNL